MPQDIATILDLLEELKDLLQITHRCSPVLFDQHFRSFALPAIDEALERFSRLVEYPQLWQPEDHQEMVNAGFTGAQLKMKLQSFESSARDFKLHGTQDFLEEALDKGATFLGSLAGAIPGFGSFAQELVDYLLKELRKRVRIRWPWRQPGEEVPV